MHNHDGTTSFLKILTVLVFIAVAVWWIEDRFNSTAVLIVLGCVVGTAAFVGGSLLSHMTAKVTMENVAKFTAQDAQVDRYRMQSFKEMQKGEAAMRKAEATLTVLDAKRVHQLAGQQSKLLIDAERAKWDAQHRQEEPESVDLWDIGDEDQGSGIQEWR